jgi:hypothetical protein
MARGIQPMVHMVGEKEKTAYAQDQQNIADQINKNIFGDDESGSQISTLYNNFIDEVITF